MAQSYEMLMDGFSSNDGPTPNHDEVKSGEVSGIYIDGINLCAVEFAFTITVTVTTCASRSQARNISVIDSVVA